MKLSRGTSPDLKFNRLFLNKKELIRIWDLCNGKSIKYYYFITDISIVDIICSIFYVLYNTHTLKVKTGLIKDPIRVLLRIKMDG